MVQIGEKAPDFTLPNQDGQTVKLSDFQGKKVVIFAFPKAGTAGCTMQACAFRDEFPKIETANGIVLGISADPPAALKTWKDRQNLQYDLLSDPKQQVLDEWQAGGMSLLGVVKVPFAKRSYWVLDETGTIIDMKIGIGPRESVNKALQALN